MGDIRQSLGTFELLAQVGVTDVGMQVIMQEIASNMNKTKRQSSFCGLTFVL